MTDKKKKIHKNGAGSPDIENIGRRHVLSSAGGLAAAALAAGAGTGLADAAATSGATPSGKPRAPLEPAAAKNSAQPSKAGAPRAHPKLQTPVERYVTVTEGTNIAPSVSPDGKTIAFDLYGSLWLVPIEGGPAKRLTSDLDEVAQPDWSPDSKTLVYQSYRDGNFHIWTINADGTGQKQLTRGPRDCREPRYSPDGRFIAYSSDLSGRYAVQVLELNSGNVRAVTPSSSTAQESEPAWS